jgi:hypothetical protein
MSHEFIRDESLVLEALQSDEMLTMDGLTERVPQLSWSELFTIVDRLSRQGAIMLRRRGFQYEVSLNPLVA